MSENRVALASEHAVTLWEDEKVVAFVELTKTIGRHHPSVQEACAAWRERGAVFEPFTRTVNNEAAFDLDTEVAVAAAAAATLGVGVDFNTFFESEAWWVQAGNRTWSVHPNEGGGFRLALLTEET